MTTFRLIIICILISACSKDLKPRHYTSPDEFTGGFNNFDLKLVKNGNLELSIETSIATVENNSGTIWETKSKKVTGVWDLITGVIKCNFKESKSSIDSIFDKTDFEHFKQKKIIYFSKGLDTAYIYGIPCLDKNNK